MAKKRIKKYRERDESIREVLSVLREEGQAEQDIKKVLEDVKKYKDIHPVDLMDNVTEIIGMILFKILLMEGRDLEATIHTLEKFCNNLEKHLREIRQKILFFENQFKKPRYID